MMTSPGDHSANIGFPCSSLPHSQRSGCVNSWPRLVAGGTVNGIVQNGKLMEAG